LARKVASAGRSALPIFEMISSWYLVSHGMVLLAIASHCLRKRKGPETRAALPSARKSTMRRNRPTPSEKPGLRGFPFSCHISTKSVGGYCDRSIRQKDCRRRMSRNPTGLPAYCCYRWFRDILCRPPHSTRPRSTKRSGSPIGACPMSNFLRILTNRKEESLPLLWQPLKELDSCARDQSRLTPRGVRSAATKLRPARGRLGAVRRIEVEMGHGRRAQAQATPARRR
jgi:hypothetical protein